MATHSSILAWEIPWTEEPRGLWSVGLQRVRHDCMHMHTLSLYIFKDLSGKWIHDVSSWPTLTQQREPVKLVNWINLVSTNWTTFAFPQWGLSKIKARAAKRYLHRPFFFPHGCHWVHIAVNSWSFISPWALRLGFIFINLKLPFGGLAFVSPNGCSSQWTTLGYIFLKGECPFILTEPKCSTLWVEGVGLQSLRRLFKAQNSVIPFSNFTSHSSCISNAFRDLCVQLLSCVRLFMTARTIVHQAPLSIGFPRQEYWSGLPFHPPGDLLHPRTEPECPACATRKALKGTENKCLCA